MGKIQVYLVEDYPVICEGVRRFLEQDSKIVVVGTANSAEEALAQLQLTPAQVVLMDIRLPGISGIEATRQIKARFPDVRVLVLSAFGNEYLAQAIEAGADGFLLKTTSQAELAGAVKQAAEGGSPMNGGLASKLLGQFAQLYHSHAHRLSQRQLTILRRVAEGVSSREITAELAISEATFKRDIRSVFDYLGVNDRAHAVAEAYKRSLL